jgi:hypothetical protein
VVTDQKKEDEGDIAEELDEALKETRETNVAESDHDERWKYIMCRLGRR